MNHTLLFVVCLLTLATAVGASLGCPRAQSVIVTHEPTSHLETFSSEAPGEILSEVASEIQSLLGQFQIQQLGPNHILVCASDPETVSRALLRWRSSGSKILGVEWNQPVTIHARSWPKDLEPPKSYGKQADEKSKFQSQGSLTKPGGKVKVHAGSVSSFFLLAAPAPKSKPTGKPKAKPQFIQPASSSVPAPWHLDILDGVSGDNTNGLDGYYSSIYTGGESAVNVYVIDTGVDVSVSEFAGRASFLADILGDSQTSDCNGHGTIVATMVTGTTSGSAKGVAVKSIRALDCDGNGYISDVITAINTALAHSTSARKVINLSLGSSSVSIALDSAISSAVGQGVTVVVSAGNDGANACDFSPSRAADAVTVGSHTPNGDLSGFSNKGACVDLFAPGEPIEAPSIGDISLTVSGTSFSAPLVSGLAAMALAHQSFLTVAQVQGLLTSRAYSSQAVRFAKNPYPSPAELNGVPDIGTNIPYSGTAEHSNLPIVFAVFFFLAGAFVEIVGHQ